MNCWPLGLGPDAGVSLGNDEVVFWAWAGNDVPPRRAGARRRCGGGGLLAHVPSVVRCGGFLACDRGRQAPCSFRMRTYRDDGARTQQLGSGACQTSYPVDEPAAVASATPRRNENRAWTPHLLSLASLGRLH